jgi:hypothetical protein
MQEQVYLVVRREKTTIFQAGDFSFGAMLVGLKSTRVE